MTAQATTPRATPALVDDELDLLASLVPLAGQQVVELGCGAAALVRQLLRRHADSHVTALEVDERQHAKNLAAPQDRLQFIAAGAQAVPLPDACADLALMLKSLHHVPLPLLGQALGEAARILKPGGHLYVSEPVFAGPLNELVRLFNDEQRVRAAAQAAVDEALRGDRWQAVADLRFEMPVRFDSFAQFEQRMMRPTFADHGIDDAKVAEVAAAYAPMAAPDGSLALTRPMHVRLLRRTAAA